MAYQTATSSRPQSAGRERSAIQSGGSLVAGPYFLVALAFACFLAATAFAPAVFIVVGAGLLAAGAWRGQNFAKAALMVAVVCMSLGVVLALFSTLLSL